MSTGYARRKQPSLSLDGSEGVGYPKGYSHPRYTRRHKKGKTVVKVEDAVRPPEKVNETMHPLPGSIPVYLPDSQAFRRHTKRDVSANWRGSAFRPLKKGRSGNRHIGYVSTPGYGMADEQFRDTTRQDLSTQVIALLRSCQKIERRLIRAATEGNISQVAKLAGLLTNQRALGEMLTARIDVIDATKGS